MSASQLLEGLSYPERKVLLTLNQLNGSASPERIFQVGEFQQQVEVMNAASWLQSKGLIEIQESAKKWYSLRSAAVLDNGLPERKALDFIGKHDNKSTIAQLEEGIGKADSSLAIGWLKRKGLVNFEKSGPVPVLVLNENGLKAVSGDMADEQVLKSLASGDRPETELDMTVVQQLKTRQELITEKLVISRTFGITDLGKEVVSLGIELKEEVAQLTPELIQTGKWKEVSLRRYDIKTFAPAQYAAKKHPLTRIGDEIRRIFVQMGFTEIEDEFVQPAFWNMDALFTPQDHPARDMQDTFYLGWPKTVPLDDEGVVSKVKAVHENGGDTGSLGWRSKWSRDEAERALLRTHTTVNTIRYLSKHPDPPAKVFSIGRIFRNEAIDATHLPEFMQIEGIIVEEGASFDMLVGVLKEFYQRMGFDIIRFRPGPFPYTEPSLEIEVFYNNRWMELGGAGVFRPEVASPLGLKYPVLAWGLGFERLAMLRWNLKDIRELYVTDLDLLRSSPIF
ncbi:MAG: Phenylalanine--tRNA ligase alpha subunit [Methanomassiliicoccales archaeon PtaU1.Bin124]|nr:MAG: Phenylalanine--tRNA ligase alpha subunit [Methanomassiliicoccales archaeon PtaU1.Bin124]